MASTRPRAILHLDVMVLLGPVIPNEPVDLTGEAIRLTRLLHRLLPREGEVAGLLALMLLTDARRAAANRPRRFHRAPG